MAGVTRTLTFAEGVSTSGPTTTFLQTTQFATYADEATFVSNKGSAAADGDAFYDTTLDVVKIYANGAWQIIYDDSDTNVALLTGTQTFSGAKTFSSAVTVSDSTSSTTKDTGSIVTEGGIGIEENLNVGGNAIITGDLTVNGTTTTVDDLVVTDETITVNNGGTQANADTNDAGLIVSMSDATNATVHYDSTATSKWKLGEVGSTVEAADISSSQVLTNKDIDGGTASNTSRITLPKASTSTLDALTRKEGTLVFDTDINKVKYDDGTNLNELGGGAGGINYISNGDAEGGNTEWATYADAAGSIPVDGTGGSPTVTWTASASGPLRGVQSFVLTKDAANRQGEGVGTDFDIDNADLHSVLSISFDATTSANYVDDDVIVYIYNTDSAELIEPVPIELKAGESGTFNAQFQTHATDNSYRLIFHVSSTNANAYTVKIDNIRVGPSERNFGVPVSDWQSYTPSSSWSTNTSIDGQWRRIGDSMECQVDIQLSGAPDAATLTFDIPSGYTIDTSKVAAASTDRGVFGSAHALDFGGTFKNANVVYSDTNSVKIISDGGSVGWSNTVPVTWGASDQITAIFKVPISGWGSTVQMSDQDSTRIVALNAQRNSGGNQTITAGVTTTVQFTTVNHDTHGAWDSGNYKMVAPVSGYYRVGGQLSIIMGATAPAFIRVFVSGTTVVYEDTLTNSKGYSVSYDETSWFNKGDDILVQVFAQTQNVNIYTEGSFVNIERVSGPSAIAANELVTCTYRCDSGKTMVQTTFTTVDWDTKIEDSHGIMNTSTGEATIPVSGNYDIKFFAQLVSEAWLATEVLVGSLYVNGTAVLKLGDFIAQAGVTVSATVQGKVTYPLVKDDVVTIRLWHNTNVSGVALESASPTNGNPVISITRQGF
jgi:hypothetical protein